MRKPSSPPKLAVIPQHPGATLPEPPCKLGTAGMDLWRGIVSSYEFSDAALLRPWLRRALLLTGRRRWRVGSIAMASRCRTRRGAVFASTR
jgi:hypothetical protein